MGGLRRRAGARLAFVFLGAFCCPGLGSGFCTSCSADDGEGECWGRVHVHLQPAGRLARRVPSPSAPWALLGLASPLFLAAYERVGCVGERLPAGRRARRVARAHSHWQPKGQGRKDKPLPISGSGSEWR